MTALDPREVMFEARHAIAAGAKAHPGSVAVLFMPSDEQTRALLALGEADASLTWAPPAEVIEQLRDMQAHGLRADVGTMAARLREATAPGWVKVLVVARARVVIASLPLDPLSPGGAA